ncbi:hypothetical protein GYH30_038378 [Glycine max]|uniref:TauD/TfdA-like domain-containing protein n=1 Tax=Glycine max TaxID=3847 RepID=I1M5G5_SOYBN|nr:hypothetical protein GYH30_038378 [Glycine max]
MGSSLVEIQVPGQKLVNGVPFPAVVSPPPATASSVPLRDSVKTQKAFLESLLEKHGLLYTRVLGEDDNPNSPIGRGLKSTFLTNHKTLAQQSEILQYGQPLPSHIVYDCLHILEEESVAIPWQKGDVLLIDNWAVLYSRRSFDPPCQLRSVLYQRIRNKNCFSSNSRTMNY